LSAVLTERYLGEPEAERLLELAQYPLARLYGWHSPIQDDHVRRPPLSESVVAPAPKISESRFFTLKRDQRDPSKTAAEVELEYKQRREQERADREAKLSAFCAEYLLMINEPYRKGQLKELAIKHKLAYHTAVSTLSNRRLMKRRKP